MKETAQRLGEQLRREDGVAEAVRVMESILERASKTKSIAHYMDRLTGFLPRRRS